LKTHQGAQKEAQEEGTQEGAQGGTQRRIQEDTNELDLMIVTTISELEA
jgi:hypothetical protein